MRRQHYEQEFRLQFQDSVEASGIYALEQALFLHASESRFDVQTNFAAATYYC